MLHNLCFFALFTLGSAEELRYAAFVVDDTASMANEIEGVKQWITNCMSGNDATNVLCENTDQYILATFNDPTTGAVIGPASNDSISAAMSKIKPHGGGNCSESLYEGIENAVAAVPDGGNMHRCNVFVFSDGDANNQYKAADIYRQASKKGCLITILLLGCCGERCQGCPSVDGKYCINLVNYDFEDFEVSQFDVDYSPPTPPPTEAESQSSPASPPAAAPLARDPHYAIFLLDYSMKDEMEYVKWWVEDCLQGENGNTCANFQRFVLLTFNDKKTGKVVGPTSAESISQALGNVTTRNGDEKCRRSVHTAILEAMSTITLDDGIFNGCFVFLFTDSDPEIGWEAHFALQSKNCNLYPLLTGCCGPCPDDCPTENKPYCFNEVFVTNVIDEMGGEEENQV